MKAFSLSPWFFRLPIFFSKFALLVISISIILAPILYFLLLLYQTKITVKVHQYFVFSEKGPSFTSSRPKSWVPLKQVSNKVLWPIILSEDWGFYQHGGIDWNQLGIVLREASETFEFKRGASTITQQVVKNLFLSKERSFFRKFNEMLLTFYVEQVLSKSQILERYVNLAEFDHHLYGVGKASWHYFKKSPSQISWREGAFLALVLPSPKRYSVSFHRKKLSPFVRRQLHHILNKARMAGLLSEEELYQQLGTPFSWEEAPAGDLPHQSLQEGEAPVNPAVEMDQEVEEFIEEEEEM